MMQSELFDLEDIIDADDRDSWMTPAWVVELAREIMGSIDLDPASNERAQATVQATTHYTIHDDGLAHEWEGNVYCNPPYSKGLIDRFAHHAIAQWRRGEINQMILLTNTSSAARWYQALVEECTVMAFPSPRIQFVHPHLQTNGNNYDQTCFYFGDRWRRFTRAWWARKSAVVGPMFRTMGDDYETD